VGDLELAELALEITRRFREAETEVLIITPYFVPGKKGVETLIELMNRGTRVVVITNSLASTNHLPVHSGYARYRKPLLQAGAEIYEIRADAVRLNEDAVEQPDTLTLHSKATIIDRDTVFVGSLNFDPRSVLQNTEMGLFIESEEIGGALFEAVRDSLGEATYKVTLDGDGDLLWTRVDQPAAEPLRKEPQTSWIRRFMAGFYGLLPIESQL
jgi:putative cardiolipin synthase